MMLDFSLVTNGVRPIQRLRRVKAMRILKDTPEEHGRADAPLEPVNARRLLRVWLSDPWDDYCFIRHLSSQDQGAVAYKKGSYFDLAIIRDLCTPDTQT